MSRWDVDHAKFTNFPICSHWLHRKVSTLARATAHRCVGDRRFRHMVAGGPTLACINKYNAWVHSRSSCKCSGHAFQSRLTYMTSDYFADTHCKLHLYVARCQQFMRFEALPLLNVRLYRTEAQIYA
eukprot:528858-Amphidinium_carterae.1